MKDLLVSGWKCTLTYLIESFECCMELIRVSFRNMSPWSASLCNFFMIVFYRLKGAYKYMIGYISHSFVQLEISASKNWVRAIGGRALYHETGLSFFCDPFVCSCFITFSILWLVCGVLMKTSTDKKPRFQIRSRNFLIKTWKMA